MIISDTLKVFIKEARDLINTNDYVELYRLANEKSFLFVCELTNLLYSADIDPLYYMTYIPRNFLRESDIDTFTIPSHIQVIGSSAFRFCDKLKEIEMPSSVINIEDSAFLGCLSLKNINLPKGIKILGRNTFDHCSELESVTIPVGIEEIKGFAFKGCDKLSHIHYSGTKKEWNNINIDGSNYMTFCNNVAIHCTDGDIEI